jgi:hypothetical protein
VLPRKLAFSFLAIILWLLAGSSLRSETSDSSLLYDSNGTIVGLDLVVGTAFDDVDSIQLNDTGKELLNQFMQRTGSGPANKISIIGYADSVAAATGDSRQSYGRALEVKASLLSLGFSGDSVSKLTGLDTISPYWRSKKQPGIVEIRIAGAVPVYGATPLVAASSAATPMPTAISSPQAASQALPATPSPEATPSPLAVVPSPSPTPLELNQFAVGLGYPDLRARLALRASWDIEAKFAFEQGIAVYSARLYWNPLDLGPTNLKLGAEVGYATYNGVDTLNGNAIILEPFLGLEYPFAHRFRLSVDVGPAYIQASAAGSTLASTDIVYNTALYIYLY